MTVYWETCTKCGSTRFVAPGSATGDKCDCAKKARR